MKMSFLLANVFQALQRNSVTLLIRFRDVLYKLLIVVLTSSVILWLSIFLYVSFYYAYMPSVSHTKPAHLQFSWCENKSMCSFPQAYIPLVKKGQDQLLVRGQQYKVYLDLEMPESPVNQELGMFMVKVDFRSKTDDVIHSTSKAAMLRYKSKLHQIFYTIFLSPFLLSGSTEEKQIISIELCDYYEEDPIKPSVGIVIEIQSKNVEIYSSQLRIYAHFTGLRYMMFHWPVVSAIIGIGTNLFFLFIVALMSWYRYLVSQEAHQVVVRVAFDDSRMKSIEERRNQVRDFLLREKQRQSKMHASFSLFEMNGPLKSVKTTESLTRTHSLETLSPTSSQKRKITAPVSSVKSSSSCLTVPDPHRKLGIASSSGLNKNNEESNRVEELFPDQKIEVDDDDDDDDDDLEAVLRHNNVLGDDSDSDHIIGNVSGKHKKEESVLVNNNCNEHLRQRKISKESEF